MNKVILIGRLTREPEAITNGVKYTLAVKREVKNGQDVDFINCSAFGKTGEFAQKYLHKGMMILAEGKLRVNKSGDKTYTNVVVDAHEFVENKRKEEDSPAQEFFDNEGGLPF